MKLDLLTNATVVEDAIRFVSSNRSKSTNTNTNTNSADSTSSSDATILLSDTDAVVDFCTECNRIPDSTLTFNDLTSATCTFPSTSMSVYYYIVWVAKGISLSVMLPKQYVVDLGLRKDGFVKMSKQNGKIIVEIAT
jgi:hypothetical protein